MRRRPSPAAPAAQVRLIGGRWRGRKLEVAAAPDLRPTPNRLRETLFNWLQSDIEGLHCLDLYAGTGALGWEALSRGAAHSTFVEIDARARALLLANSVRLEAAHQVRVVAQPVQTFLAQPSTGFDLVFADPPFAADAWADLLAALPPHLRRGARVYLERPSGYSAPWVTDLGASGWRVLRESRAGGATGTLLTHETGVLC